ncbi:MULTISPECIES: hypothetical protein [Vibrio]|uniref:Uncharacterized protein n=1 Tax=Vibrio atlanticus TaxID=693153 RepID=A0A1C3IQB3_9VIBR|nr:MULTISPECIES: hypothetical protein [Vibrio]SBS63580.1 hypothetical protein VAT7223_01738 [Vibrio atlanticus]
MKTRRLCFDTLANSPALPVFLGKADKQLPACLAALKHAFYAVVKIYT